MLSILISLISVSISYAVTTQELSKCVVYIKESKPIIETFEGKKYQIWRKDIENDQLSQKFRSIGGTGFLITHNKKIYLVTAAHVAKTITKNAKIYWNTGSGKMNHFSFDFIQKNYLDQNGFFIRTLI